MGLIAKAKLPSRFTFSATAISAELNDAFEALIKDARLQFINTTLDFETPVFFTISGGGNFRATISTDDQNYGRLNAGTSAHLISPKPGGVLRFPSAYGRKTNPGMLYSVPGYRSKDFIFTKLPVMNPGFPPRAFDKAVVKYIQPKMKKQIQAALKKAMKV